MVGRWKLASLSSAWHVSDGAVSRGPRRSRSARWADKMGGPKDLIEHNEKLRTGPYPGGGEYKMITAWNADRPRRLPRKTRGSAIFEGYRFDGHARPRICAYTPVGRGQWLAFCFCIFPWPGVPVYHQPGKRRLGSDLWRT